jgi:hypothetical protein
MIGNRGRLLLVAELRDRVYARDAQFDFVGLLRSK